MAHIKTKQYKRRFIFEGWSNYTDFENQMILDFRQFMKDKHKMDLDSNKEFGPRTADSYCRPGTMEILPGVDCHFSD